jgi:cardiolipin synthase A/B
LSPERSGGRPRRLRRLRRFLRPIVHPVVGRRLPPELCADRVGGLCTHLAGGVEDPEFAALLEKIDDSPIHPSNQVEIYTHGDDAFAAMRDAIKVACEEVLLESYILRDDTVGRRFLDLLAAAVERGVSVRVLADAVGSFSTRRAFWREMADRGIELRLFHPLFSGLWNQVFRDHRKILVVDRKIGFTGGMNLSEDYGSFSRSRKKGGTWRDTHVRVDGSAAWEMAVVFSEGWERTGGDPLKIPPLPLPENPEPGIGVLVLDSRPFRGHHESASVLVAIAAAARRTLWITNAYFAPGRAAVRELGAAARRGVDVRLLLPGKTDAPIVRYAAHGMYAELLEVGVRIFEYQAAVLHAKSLVADGHLSLVGSSNLDFRSFFFNAECNLVILGKDSAQTLEQAFAADLAQSEEILAGPWRARPLAHRLRDGLARCLAPIL